MCPFWQGEDFRVSNSHKLSRAQCENWAHSGEQGEPASDLCRWVALRWKSGQVMEKEVEQLLGKKLGCRWAMWKVGRWWAGGGGGGGGGEHLGSDHLFPGSRAGTGHCPRAPTPAFQSLGPHHHYIAPHSAALWRLHKSSTNLTLELIIALIWNAKTEYMVNWHRSSTTAARCAPAFTWSSKVSTSAIKYRTPQQGIWPPFPQAQTARQSTHCDVHQREMAHTAIGNTLGAGPK